MEHFLTAKARPVWIVRVLAVLLAIALIIWCAAGITALLDKYLVDMSAAEVIAFLILFGVPVFILLLMCRWWHRGATASKIASSLAMETENELAWEQVEAHTGVKDARAKIVFLYEKRYLTNLLPDFEKLTLQRDFLSAHAEPSAVRKCAMCGAPLDQRTGGRWTCRFCGSVAGR